LTEWKTVSSERGRATYRIQLNPATEVQVNVQQHLHGSILQRVEGVAMPTPVLNLRARCFGLYVICLGRLRGGQQFVVEHSVLMKHREALEIPLHLEIIPSQKVCFDFLFLFILINIFFFWTGVCARYREYVGRASAICKNVS
jgi:hypothetical protein